MNTLDSNDMIYLDKYNIHTHKYLSYAEVQAIAEAVTKFDSWADREQCLDMLMLVFATDIGKDELEKHTHEELLRCGLIEDVRNNILNIYDIQNAIKYMESLSSVILGFIREYQKNPDILKNLIKE